MAIDLKFLDYLEDFLTENRKERFLEVLANRTNHFTIAMEDVYQLHNTSAVMRSCEVFGIQELNVVEQVLDLGKTSIVQTAWESGQTVHVHGWVYDIHDGLIKDLDVTLRDNKSLSDVYQLDI